MSPNLCLFRPARRPTTLAVCQNPILSSHLLHPPSLRYGSSAALQSSASYWSSVWPRLRWEMKTGRQKDEVRRPRDNVWNDSQRDNTPASRATINLGKRSYVTPSEAQL